MNLTINLSLNQKIKRSCLQKVAYFVIKLCWNAPKVSVHHSSQKRRFIITQCEYFKKDLNKQWYYFREWHMKDYFGINTHFVWFLKVLHDYPLLLCVILEWFFFEIRLCSSFSNFFEIGDGQMYWKA